MALLAEQERLQNTSRMNHMQRAAAARNWRHRIRDILTTLREPVPPALAKELDEDELVLTALSARRRCRAVSFASLSAESLRLPGSFPYTSVSMVRDFRISST